MNFEALDGARLTILMIAGAVFAAAGLYLLLKPKGSGTAKIELFGLKFESSSAGLLVFLIGAIFMALPLFVPERTTGTTQTQGAGSETTDGRETSGADATEPDAGTPSAGVTALVLPAEADVKEQEPNDSLRQANQLAVGTIAAGFIKGRNEDWYVVPVADHQSSFVQVMLNVTDGDSARVEMYNADQVKLKGIFSADGAAYGRIYVENTDRLYLKVWYVGVYDAVYEVVVRPVDSSG